MSYCTMPTGHTPASFRAIGVFDLVSGEYIASFPFSLQEMSGMADLRATMFCDVLNGLPVDEYLSAEVARVEALEPMATYSEATGEFLGMR